LEAKTEYEEVSGLYAQEEWGTACAAGSMGELSVSRRSGDRRSPGN
jgi:hypothetical protein